MIHTSAHELAGKTVTLKPVKDDPSNSLFKEGAEFRVEDWWDRISDGSWMDGVGNPACLNYAIRGGIGGLPIDDEVLYGKVGALGHLVHVSEIVVEDEPSE